MSGRRSSLGMLALKVALVVVVAYVAFVGYSSFAIYSSGTAALDAYQSCKQQFDEGDLEAAYASVSEVASGIQNIERELNGWQWDVAGSIPVVGEDVDCARRLSDVADKLANAALLPVLTQAKVVFAEADWSDVLKTLGDKIGEVEKLFEAVADARDVVGTCRSEVDAIPASHFEELNDAVAEVRAVTGEVDDMFTQFESLLPASE